LAGHHKTFARTGLPQSAAARRVAHFAIAQAWQGLSIEDKTNYLIVTARLHTIMTIHENPPPIDDTASIRNQHDALSQLAVFLRAFDGELAHVFERDAKV
jgi:hypothetical protein